MKMYKYYAGEITEVKEIKEVKGNKYVYTIECPRCGGHGKLDQFNHVQKGECFKCSGTGIVEKEGKLYTLEDAEKLQRKYLENKEKSWAKRMEQQQKELEQQEALRQAKREEQQKAYKQINKPKKRNTKNMIDEYLMEKDWEYLLYNIGFMSNSQAEQYIELLLNEGQKMTKRIKRSLIAHFEDICKKYNISIED